MLEQNLKDLTDSIKELTNALKYLNIPFPKPEPSKSTAKSKAENVVKEPKRVQTEAQPAPKAQESQDGAKLALEKAAKDLKEAKDALRNSVAIRISSANLGLEAQQIMIDKYKVSRVSELATLEQVEEIARAWEKLLA